MGVLERINEIEKEMMRTQKNKNTEYHLGCLKARLAKLRKELFAPEKTSSCASFEVQKSGDARVTLIGFPSVGKSTLLSKITTTESKAAAHEFTTLECIAGKMKINGATIQILDLPGIIKGAAQGIGRGKQVIGVARTSDVILMLLDPRKDDKAVLEKELYDMGIRLNKKKPNVSVVITNGGGISVNTTLNLTKTNEEMIKLIFKEYKMHNCMITIREDVTVDEIIDVISDSVVYIGCVYCYNKIDMLSLEKIDELSKEPGSVVISSEKSWNFEEMLEKIWDKLDLIRIYTKRKGEQPNLNEPILIKKNKTVEEICIEIHKDFVDKFKFANVWGSSAKHMPQKVGLSHILQDEDVIQIYTA